jgi:hypothetical protein
VNSEEPELNTPLLLSITMGSTTFIAVINGWDSPFGPVALVISLLSGGLLSWFAPPQFQYLFFRKDYGNRMFFNVLSMVLFPFLLVAFGIIIIEQYWIFISSLLFAYPS